MQPIQIILKRFAQRPLRETLLLLLPLLLSGCLRYDLTLRFDHQSHGQISQTINLSDRGAALAQPTLEPWLEELKVRSRPLGGQLSQSSQTVTLTVPFGTAADLGDRFQQLFAATAAPAIESVLAEASLADGPTYLQLPGWEPVPFALDIDQTNWLLASRTHLTYALDLRQLPPNGDDSAAPAPWADLRFRLQVPWGLQLLPTATPPTKQDATGATWPLEPGEITTIDATFWLPNAIAIGTLGIVALMLAGYGLRYRIFKPRFPNP
ncbi:DUF3153 domain-containing protein [Nodosilinea sp. FACHB-131]|uniref:DUF3153 domain-containing protein n=1 Tax=Cyanophyceae TaxID=3028117 RepID=UPI001682B58C|nr:DUF3153 domain-containing protein [Nodosilinea sp. FACHB-131]MBD1873917.1 DUF3153 domain-containing protein [Nodosilinea sp. FACHB-131]